MQEFFDCIVVPVAFDDKTTTTIHQAATFARLFNCDIILLHVFVPRQRSNITCVENIQNELFQLATQCREKYEITFYHHLVISDNVAQTIVDFSSTHYARMIVMGDTSSSTKKQIGKNTEQIIRLSQCPVLTIRTKIIYEIEKLLLPLDISKPTEHKMSWAIYFAKMFGCILKVIYIAPTSSRELLDASNARLSKIKAFLNENNVFCMTEVLYRQSILENESQIILDYAQKHNCDMIMIMTRQQMKPNSEIGRTANKIISLSDIPVITITPTTKNIFIDIENIQLV